VPDVIRQAENENDGRDANDFPSENMGKRNKEDAREDKAAPQRHATEKTWRALMPAIRARMRDPTVSPADANRSGDESSRKQAAAREGE
jgi:hypothetical protein